MNQIVMRYQAAVFVAVLLLWVQAAGAKGETLQIYPVREVAAGLSGTGYTVVQGDTIESFDVEVLGVLENAAPTGDLVLVRASGGVVERTGGIAAGMSGSPVYVDGRLLGGIGYGFQFADHRVGLVTPAEDMMEVLELALARRSTAKTDGVRWRGAGPQRGPAQIAIAPDSAGAAALQSRLGDDVWVASPVATPVAVSGFGARALGRIRTFAERFDLVPVLGGSSAAQDGDRDGSAAKAIFPGSALGVQLMRGDASVTVVGTVTHVEDGGFVAFGHPFLNRGNVNYYATRAEVLTTVTSVSTPFKLANSGAPVGAIVQDRGAGIGGLLGDEPESVELSVDVTDEDRGKATHFSIWTVKDEVLTAPLLVIGALEAVDRGIDRIGEGTGWVELAIHGDEMAEPLVRSNMFFSEFDIAAEVLIEAYEALLLLSENEFKDPKLRSVEISIRIEQGRKTVSVVKAAPHEERVRPGERVLVDVTLRPYREDAYTITVPLDIPEWVAPGDVTVSVQGGGYAYGGFLPEGLDDALAFAFLGEEEDDDGERTRAESLDKIVEDFKSRPKNNDLVLEFYPPFGFGANGRDHGEVDGETYDFDEDFLEFDEPVRVTHSLAHVVLGDAYFTLEIEEAPDAVTPAS